MEYKLEKLEIKEGKTSGVRSGSIADGVCYHRARDAEAVKDPKIEDIKVGDMVLVVGGQYNFIKTNEITSIIEVTDNSVKFETGSSIYLLEVL